MEPHGKYTRPKIRFNELDRAHDGTAFRLATRHTGSTSERKKRDTNLPNGERETAAGPALSCSAAPRRHYLKWEERGGERPWRWSNEALPSCRVREFRPSAGERAPRGHALPPSCVFDASESSSFFGFFEFCTRFLGARISKKRATKITTVSYET